MKFLLPLFLLSFFILFSCSKDNSLINNKEDLDPTYFDINELNEIQKMNNSHKRPIKVFRAPGTMQIDGHDNDWKRAPRHRMRVEIDLGYDLDNKWDLNSYFRMLWDDNNLYVFASILDEEINVGAEQLFEKDGFEIYIDGNNSKTEADYDNPTFPPAAYGNNTDFFRFIPGEPAALGAWGIINTSNFESKVLLTQKGYDVEVRIPLSSFPDFAVESGHHFGVEFQVNDNDNDERQHLLKWWSGSDFSYLDPSLFGTAILHSGNN